MVAFVSGAVVLNTTANSVSSLYTATSDFDVVGGADHVLVVVGEFLQNNTTASDGITMTAEGVTMTPAVRFSHTSGLTYPIGGIFYLVNPSPGLTTIVGSFAPINGRAAIMYAMELSGIDPADPIGAIASSQAATSFAAPATITPEASGNFIVSALGLRGDGSPFAPVANVTERADAAHGTSTSNDVSAFVGTYDTVGTSSVNVGATPTALNGAVFHAVEFRAGVATVSGALARTLDDVTVASTALKGNPPTVEAGQIVGTGFVGATMSLTGRVVTGAVSSTYDWRLNDVTISTTNSCVPLEPGTLVCIITATNTYGTAQDSTDPVAITAESHIAIAAITLDSATASSASALAIAGASSINLDTLSQAGGTGELHPFPLIAGAWEFDPNNVEFPVSSGQWVGVIRFPPESAGYEATNVYWAGPDGITQPTVHLGQAPSGYRRYRMSGTLGAYSLTPGQTSPLVGVYYTLATATGLSPRSLTDLSYNQPIPIALTATLADATVAASGFGVSAIAGDASVALDAATVSATATLATAGTLALTLGAATSTGTATTDIVGFSSATLVDATVSSGAVIIMSGSLVVGLADLTMTAASTLDSVGAGSAMLAAATLSSVGVLLSGVSGEVNATLADVGGASTGQLAIAGAAAPQLENATVAASGELLAVGTLTATLGEVVGSGSSALDLSGNASASLANVTLLSSAVTEQQSTADLNVTFGNVTLASAATLANGGFATIDLANATLASAATLIEGNAGTVIRTLDAATLASTGVIAAAGSLGATLDGVVVVAQSALSIDAVAAVTLEDATVVASPAATLIASADVTLADATLMAKVSRSRAPTVVARRRISPAVTDRRASAVSLVRPTAMSGRRR